MNSSLIVALQQGHCNVKQLTKGELAIKAPNNTFSINTAEVVNLMDYGLTDDDIRQSNVDGLISKGFLRIVL